LISSISVSEQSLLKSEEKQENLPKNTKNINENFEKEKYTGGGSQGTSMCNVKLLGKDFVT